ncbi:hypothetical protein L804_04151 [Cryptococcus deuterogattii 2001/935-1]|nr:hypothetical protein L804_04151 [Cryptococcus deuterogattii 2001/935-1]
MLSFSLLFLFSTQHRARLSFGYRLLLSRRWRSRLPDNDKKGARNGNREADLRVVGVDEGRQGWGRKREKWRSRGLEKGQKMRIYIEVGAPMRRRAAAPSSSAVAIRVLLSATSEIISPIWIADPILLTPFVKFIATVTLPKSVRPPLTFLSGACLIHEDVNIPMLFFRIASQGIRRRVRSTGWERILSKHGVENAPLWSRFTKRKTSDCYMICQRVIEIRSSGAQVNEWQ